MYVISLLTDTHTVVGTVRGTQRHNSLSLRSLHYWRAIKKGTHDRPYPRPLTHRLGWGQGGKPTQVQEAWLLDGGIQAAVKPPLENQKASWP